MIEKMDLRHLELVWNASPAEEREAVTGYGVETEVRLEAVLPTKFFLEAGLQPRKT